jgi:heme transporter 1
MVRGLEAFSRKLTGIRIGWAGLALIVSFTAAVSISVKEYPAPCVGLPICFGIAGVAQLWDLIAHVMYLQDLWRPWLRGLKLFLYVGIFLLLSTIGTCISFIVMGSLEKEWSFSFCSWFISAVATCWPLLSSAQLTLHAKIYRDEFRDLRTLLDY